MTHKLKCGCWSCTEYRRDNARLHKFRRKWAERDMEDRFYTDNDRARQVKLLRFLADELEAHRAHVDLDVSIDREYYDHEPCSMHESPNDLINLVRDIGSRWQISASTLKIPELT